MAACQTNIFSAVLLRVMSLQTAVCSYLHTRPCVAQQNAHPVHFPLATLEEDSNSWKAVSSRGCSQNHHQPAWWRVPVCSCTQSIWLWSNFKKLEDDVILVCTSPGWDIALQSPNLIPRFFKRKNSLNHPTTNAIPKIVFQNWKKIRQRWGEGYITDWRIKKKNSFW